MSVENEIRIQRQIIRHADREIENLLWSIHEAERSIPRMEREVAEYARHIEIAEAQIAAMEEEA